MVVLKVDDSSAQICPILAAETLRKKRTARHLRIIGSEDDRLCRHGLSPRVGSNDQGDHYSAKAQQQHAI